MSYWTMTRRSGACPGCPVRRMMRTVSFLSSLRMYATRSRPAASVSMMTSSSTAAMVGWARKPGAFMHGLIVVDHRDLPFTRGRGDRNGSGIVDQVEDIVLFGHCGVPSL